MRKGSRLSFLIVTCLFAHPNHSCTVCACISFIFHDSEYWPVLTYTVNFYPIPLSLPPPSITLLCLLPHLLPRSKSSSTFHSSPQWQSSQWTSKRHCEIFLAQRFVAFISRDCAGIETIWPQLQTCKERTLRSPPSTPTYLCGSENLMAYSPGTEQSRMLKRLSENYHQLLPYFLLTVIFSNMDIGLCAWTAKGHCD